MQILRQLASMPSPWIDHTDDLAVTIDYLTAENKPESHFDMERLFHSCRLNEEVTKETRKTLQSIWKDAVTEQVRLKILAIFDRLMDRAIFNVGDSHFHSMLMWFRHIEKTLDPYKNAAAINMLQRIVSKADEIKRQGLAPIPLNHVSVECGVGGGGGMGAAADTHGWARRCTRRLTIWKSLTTIWTSTGEDGSIALDPQASMAGGIGPRERRSGWTGGRGGADCRASSSPSRPRGRD